MSLFGLAHEARPKDGHERDRYVMRFGGLEAVRELSGAAPGEAQTGLPSGLLTPILPVAHSGHGRLALSRAVPGQAHRRQGMGWAHDTTVESTNGWRGIQSRLQAGHSLGGVELVEAAQPGCLFNSEGFRRQRTELFFPWNPCTFNKRPV